MMDWDAGGVVGVVGEMFLYRLLIVPPYIDDDEDDDDGGGGRILY